MEEHDAPVGRYGIAGTAALAEVTYVSPIYTNEIRARWIPDDPEHLPLNDLFAHLSVLEMDHFAAAAARGDAYTVEPLEDLLPRPGWEVGTRTPDDPTRYVLTQLASGAVHRGLRRDLLLLLELAARSAVAPYADKPAPRDWVQRTRDVLPKLIEALQGEAPFEKLPDR